MRIAVLGIKRLPAVGGADRVVERLLDHLPPEHEYTIYLLRGAGPPLPADGNRRYVYVRGFGGKHLRPFTYFLSCSLHVLFGRRYDVAHVHNSDFGVFCLLLKARPALRVIGTFHGDPYERGKWSRAAKLYLRLSEWCFVRSCDVLTSVAVSKTVPRRDVHYIPNGVDPWAGANGESGILCEELGLEKGSYVMFACGRLDSTKGLHHLLHAYMQLPAVTAADRLLAVGDFSHDAEYSNRIVEEAASNRRVVLHNGLLEREALLEVIHNSSVFVFPSEVEAMSMMLLEAIACARLVVCSDIPENLAVVGVDYPLLFESGDAASLAVVLTTALDASVRGHDMRPELAEATARLRWDAIADEYGRLYQGV
jgi:glycosyltransferase involved in cell wall biosynthesis